MPLPSTWALVPVTATYTRRDGEPASGRVVFTSPQIVVVDGEIIVPRSVAGELDASGELSVTLPSTDDPDISPTGWTWLVSEDVDGLVRDSYAIQVPHDSDGIDLATVAPTTPVEEVSPFAVLALANEFTEPQTLRSSFDGGDDDSDSTSRLNLESYQSSPINAFGETIRSFMRKAKAKAMQAWYFPSGGYDANLDPVGTMRPAVWAGAHWRSGDGDSLHKHWSLEVQDASGALQTRFEVVFGDQDDDTAIAGLDKTLILTNLADFVIRCSNGQVLRLAANDADEKALEWTQDTAGETRRWKLRATATQGDLQFARYDDEGVFQGGPLILKRSSGRVGIHAGDPTAPLHVGDDVRIDGDLEFPTDTTGPVLTDRATGTEYRLFVDDGTLQIESLP